MSLQNAISDSLVKTQIEFNFASPAALKTDVLGAESTIGLTQFNIQRRNIITDIQNVLDPAAGISYALYTRRLNDVRKRLGITANFQTSFDGVMRPNMPIGLAPGLVQFVEQQNVGVLTKQDYIITTIRPLAV